MPEIIVSPVVIRDLGFGQVNIGNAFESSYAEARRERQVRAVLLTLAIRVSEYVADG